LAYFLKAKLVHSIVGSPNLLSFEQCTQVIYHFDVNKGSFMFVDRDNLDKPTAFFANLFANSLYGWNG